MQWHWVPPLQLQNRSRLSSLQSSPPPHIKRKGPAWLQAVQDRERAQAGQAREQAALAREQSKRIRPNWNLCDDRGDEPGKYPGQP